MKSQGKYKKLMLGKEVEFVQKLYPCKGAKRKINLVESDEEIDNEVPGPSKRAEIPWLVGDVV